jgi:hypothetical protein
MLLVEDYLSKTLSRKEIDFLVETIASDPQQLPDLVNLITSENQQTAWHAAWGMEKLFIKYPELFSIQLLETITDIAIRTEKEGIRRLMLCVLNRADLPDDLPVKLINSAFGWILAENSAIAVRAISMHYLLRVCRREPDLLPELQLCVSHLLESTDSPGIRSVARKVMKAGRSTSKNY